jgi:hypothetical protein
MSTLLRPADLNQIASDSEIEKMDEERMLKKKKDQQQLELRSAFMERDIHPEVFERINQAISIAAKQGLRQVQVVTFPSSYCSDRGRRINIADPEWPSTLEGFAKRAFDFFDKELRPLGYKLHAEIISFPGGMPGDVALFLKW